MTIRTYRIRHWTVREWQFCGLLWRLILSPRWPDREHWKPGCPVCGLTRRHFALARGKYADHGLSKKTHNSNSSIL